MSDTRVPEEAGREIPESVFDLEKLVRALDDAAYNLGYSAGSDDVQVLFDEARGFRDRAFDDLLRRLSEKLLEGARDTERLDWLEAQTREVGCEETSIWRATDAWIVEDTLELPTFRDAIDAAISGSSNG